MSATPAAPPPGLACLLCKQPIADQYFLAGGVRPVCPGCKMKIEGAPLGPVGPAFGSALGLGLAAALGAAAVWAGIVVATHMLLGIVAIGVGLLIGLAVRKGAGRQSGPIFQGLAMVLTFCSLAWATAAIGVLLSDRSLALDPAMIARLAVIAFPVYLGSMAKDPFSLIFLGIALYEAWKLNRRRTLLFTGPFGKSAAIDFGRR